MSASSSRPSAPSPIGSDRSRANGDSGGGAGEPWSSLRPEPGAVDRAGSPRRSLRLKLWITAAVLAALFTFDLTRPPRDQWSARALLGAIGIYQATLSPVLGRAGVHCRFVPTCSHYGADAIREDGALKGSLRAIWRVARCGPWTKAGTIDPA